MDDRGQAAVETLWLVPVAASVIAAVALFGVNMAAESAAGSAAEAAAVAVIQQADPRTAAGRAAPDWAGSGMHLSSDGRSVNVRVTPEGLAGPFAGLVTGEARIELARVE